MDPAMEVAAVDVKAVRMQLAAAKRATPIPSKVKLL